MLVHPLTNFETQKHYQNKPAKLIIKPYDDIYVYDLDYHSYIV